MRRDEEDDLSLSYGAGSSSGTGGGGYLDKKNNRDRIKQLGAPHLLMQE